MKRAVIVHCWSGYPKYCWYQSVKKELEEKGFEVSVPVMPDTDKPKLSLWLPKLKEIIGEPDEDLYLIGHSIGVITIIRYLETLEENQKIGGAVFAAGFTDDLGISEIKNFFETDIDFKKIKKRCKKFSVILSDNDPYVAIKYGKIFEEKLVADVKILHNMGHFSGEVDNEKSCTNLPEVTKEILKMQ